MDFDYSYVKWENTINRRTGTAQHPRQLERVPAGAEFEFEMVYDLYKDGEQPSDTEGQSRFQKHRNAIELAMALLQDDYLGGQGSRGYGRIRFKNVEITQRSIDQNTGVYGPRVPASDWQDFAGKFQ